MKLILTFFFVFFTQISMCQIADNTNRLNENNIYYQTIIGRSHIEHYDKNSKIDTLYLERISAITDSLILLSDRIQIILVDQKDLERIVKTSGELTFWKVSPLLFANGNFYVPLKEVWQKFNPHTQNIDQTILSNLKVEYHFKKGKFIYSRTLVGIN